MGSAKDGLLCEEVAKTLPADRVENIAGKIDLIHLCDGLQTCSFVIGNDSGGMHLSNFCGVPTIGLFGPTNPSWGGPFYQAPTCCIASDDGYMHDLQPESVFQRIVAWLQTLGMH
jgi:ADP-heptose:LPS heptosyltransferase